MIKKVISFTLKLIIPLILTDLLLNGGSTGELLSLRLVDGICAIIRLSWITAISLLTLAMFLSVSKYVYDTVQRMLPKYTIRDQLQIGKNFYDLHRNTMQPMPCYKCANQIENSESFIALPRENQRDLTFHVNCFVQRQFEIRYIRKTPKPKTILTGANNNHE